MMVFAVTTNKRKWEKILNPGILLNGKMFMLELQLLVFGNTVTEMR